MWRLILLVGLWLPVYAHAATFTEPPLRDNFDRADGALGANWGSGIRTTDVGAAVEIISNNATRGVGTGAGSAWWNVATFGPDMAVMADVPDGTGTGFLKLYVRVQEPSTANVDYYACLFFGDGATPEEVRIVESNNDASEVILASAAFSLLDATKAGCQAEGTTIRAWADQGAGWVEQLTVTDATISAAGFGGIAFNNNTVRAGAFYAGTISAAGGRRRVEPLIFP